MLIVRLPGSWSGRCVERQCTPHQTKVERTLGTCSKSRTGLDFKPDSFGVLACTAPDLSIGGRDGIRSCPSSFSNGSVIPGALYSIFAISDV